MKITSIEELSVELRKARSEMKLTLSDLSDSSGVARNTIYNIENCRNTGSIEILFKLLRSLGKSIRIE